MRFDDVPECRVVTTDVRDPTRGMEDDLWLTAHAFMGSSRFN